MKDYDKAAYKFYTSQNLKTLPLNSWDMYAQHFDKTCQNQNDLASLKVLAKKNDWVFFPKFDKPFIQRNEVIVVTDPSLTIVHATHNIFEMNGYRPEEVIGKKPKVFQGKETDKTTLADISKAINEVASFDAKILNYRKDGTTYTCWIKGSPIFDRSGKVVNFIAYEKEVA